MREKELRLALICYGGISLAVYMHGITKEVWRLARASRAFHAGEPPVSGSEGIYRRLLEIMAQHCGLELRVLVDILTGASAGGINAVFLGQAISTGQSLEPLTDLWLETADVDRLLDPDVSTFSRIAKAAAVPFAWALSAKHGGTVEKTVEAAQREEVRTKLANFVRARWFAPPFHGSGFTRLLLNAFDAMEQTPCGRPLLPHYQPLDLFVTVTDFHGFPERLRLNSPAEVVETEHRITLSFRDVGGEARQLADPAELAFAARATASFPGAFPPFRLAELDGVLEERGRDWLTRAPFLKRAFPRHTAMGPENAILIDGSVLNNAPFRPAILALKNRPSHREVDRRFVYIDPTPGARSIKLTASGEAESPGFFATLFGALSDIPREQPIRDNLEALETHSGRIKRLRHIVEAMRPEVESAIERAFGTTLLLMRPTAPRLAAWRTKAQNIAARDAGYAYAAYGHLKLSAVVEESASIIYRLGGRGGRERVDRLREALWDHVRGRGLTADDAMTSAGAKPPVIDFFRSFDLAYRTRRLRFVARRINSLDQQPDAPRGELEEMRETVYGLIGRYLQSTEGADVGEVFANTEADATTALQELAALLSLKALDDEADAALAEALEALPKRERRAIILTYLGFAFYDIATLPLLQGEGLDEFNPVRVDRISPEDAASIRQGGAEATLKGIQFNSFGAFFSRAYRENDYLWGRLHGAERLIDITVSTLPDSDCLTEADVAALKRDAFRAILDEERERLSGIAPLFEQIEREIDAGNASTL